VNGVLERFKELGAIDLLAFLGEWPDRLALRAGPDELSAMADRLRLRGICVSHISSVLGHDTRTGNEALFAAAERDKRLWPFAILNPTEPGWEEELAWAAEKGARGIRLAPGYHGYGLRDAAVAALLPAARLHGLPLQVCVRLQDERLQHRRLRAEPVELHEVAELISAAAGHPLIVSGLRDHERDAVMRFGEARWPRGKVLFDLWFCNGPIAVISSLCRSGLTEWHGYSSCAPLHTPEATAFQLAGAAIPETDRAALCFSNALSLLGTGNDAPQQLEPAMRLYDK